MSRHDIARLAFVLLGIYVLLRCVDFFREVSSELFRDSDLTSARESLWAEGPPMILLLLTGIGLITFSGQLAGRMFKDQPQDREELFKMPALAYSVVGLACFIWGIGSLGTGISSYLDSEVGGWWDLLQPGMLIPLGVALFCGSHFLARIWWRLSYAEMRRRMGLCIRCGYDLTGNTTGICPECGTAQQAPSDRELQGK